jgi:hypothetical protein
MYHFIKNNIKKPQYTMNVLFQTIFKQESLPYASFKSPVCKIITQELLKAFFSKTINLHYMI